MIAVRKAPYDRSPFDVRPTSEEPIDYPVVREVARATEELTLATTNRPALDQYQDVLTELVQRLVREDSPDRAHATLAVFRTAYRAVDSPTKPTANDSDYRVYSHVKTLARCAASLADVLDPRTAENKGAKVGEL
ncbi:hypothetical protein AB0J38_14475 [Streptomyces sp. NPDC050095]|uniref:hypothetical protein n=1 Tax=unclassified Streptomyces TaxID=2593676 RepID=UPI003445EBE8